MILDIYGNSTYKGNFKKQINLDHLDQGIYFIEIRTNKGIIQREKLVKI